MQATQKNRQSAITSSIELFMQTGNVWNIGDLNKNINQLVAYLMLTW